MLFLVAGIRLLNSVLREYRLHRHNTGGHDGDGNGNVAKQYVFVFSATRNDQIESLMEDLNTQLNFPLAVSLPIQSLRQRESNSAITNCHSDSPFALHFCI